MVLFLFNYVKFKVNFHKNNEKSLGYGKGDAYANGINFFHQ